MVTRDDPQPPTTAQLGLAFFQMAANGFGGVGAWSRRVLVEQRHWLDDATYTELLGMAQVLPGPNVVNLAAIVGDRFRGLRGALAAVVGLVVPSTLLAIALDALLMQWMHVPRVAAAVVGLGAGAAGLVWAMGLKMGARLRGSARGLVIAAAAFATAGPLRLPVVAVVLALGPLGVALAWRRR